MQISNELNPRVMTPAFIYDEGIIVQNIRNIKQCIGHDVCQLLFPLKSFSLVDAVSLIGELVDGFSASSLFEARLAKQILGTNKSIHLTSPGLRIDEIDAISALCNFISFNSLSQYARFQKAKISRVSCGIRVNPELSFVKDRRYDPCGKHSKLGIPLTQLNERIKDDSLSITGIKGIHFHTNCESTELEQLILTLKHIEKYLSRLLAKMEWINVGGGYLFQNHTGMNRLVETLFSLKNKYAIQIYFEPGKAIVGDAGHIISSVLDLFENDGCVIAILDTSVNHVPEVFEYRYKPAIVEESSRGRYKYVLAGSTCLAGDVFGRYSFKEPLKVGSHITFENVGAYTLVKANMFNGLNLPNIYSFSRDNGSLELKKQFSYGEYISRCGGDQYDSK